MLHRIAVGLAIVLALTGPAMAGCHQVANSAGFDAHTKFQFCDDQPSSLRLNVREVAKHPDLSEPGAAQNLDVRITSPSVNVQAAPIRGWANGRATNAGFIVTLDNTDDAAALAHAINAGEVVTITLTPASTGTAHTVFSGVFAERFPDAKLPAVKAGPPSAPPVAASAGPVETLTPYQAEIDSVLSRATPYRDWMDRACVLSSAAETRETIKQERLAGVNEQISRYDELLADPALNPRAASVNERRRQEQINERDRLQRLEASSLNANNVFGRIVESGICRDQAATRAAQLEKCTKAGRGNCACEADKFASNWLAGTYRTNSSGLVRMDVDARKACGP